MSDERPTENPPKADASSSGPEAVTRWPLLAVLVAAVIAAVAFAVVALAGSDNGPAAIVPEKQGPFRGNELPDGIVNTLAPDFRHTDVRGGELDTRSLAGTPYAVTFLYTDCPDVCPLIGQELGQALDLSVRARTTWLSSR